MFGILATRSASIKAVGVSNLPTALGHVRFKRYEAFDSSLDQEALAKARVWHRAFDTSQLPKGNTTFSRSSGPGGQHVNKTETKAITAYPMTELLSLLPGVLHSGLRSSRYYTASNNSLTFQAQTHRSRNANVEENRSKLADEIARLYHESVPSETSSEKKKKHREVEQQFHETRIRQKKFVSSKKQSRKGPSE